MVALKQSEQLGHDHYSFYSIDQIRIKHWYSSYVHHSVIIEKAWIDTIFLQVLRFSNCTPITEEDQKGLAENVKMNNNKKLC